MNPPIENLETRGTTYLKAAALALPALALWIFSCVLVMPKLKEICAASNTGLPESIMFALNVSDLLKNNLLAGLAVILPALALLEWRSTWWRRHRRMIFGLSAYLLNLAVLAILTALCVTAVIAGANLMHPK